MGSQIVERARRRARNQAWSQQERLQRAAAALARRFEQLERSRAARLAAQTAPLSDERIAIWTQGATLRQCQTLADLVQGELWRRGLRRVSMGSRTYCFVESTILSDILRREMDLDEIAASLEEAKMMGMEL